MSKVKTNAMTGTVVAIVAAVVILLAAIFLMGRYGWKLIGFSACQSAAIESVEVSEDSVHITGAYPGLFPQGFLGYYAEEQDGTLYVGFRFSGIFGFFETGRFDITIPVTGEIREVMVRTAKTEHSIWNAAGTDPTDDSATVPTTEPTAEPTTEPTTEPTAEPTTEPTTEPTAEPTTEPTTEPTAEPTTAPITVPDAFAAVIDNYHTALQEGWNGGQLMDAGLNYMASVNNFAAPMEDLGYAVTDLDGDGSEELIIGTRVDDAYYGKMILSMYILDDSGNAQLLFDSTERDCYYYAGGINFANTGSSDWNSSFVTTLKLQNKELVDMTFTTDPADYVQMDLTPFSQWAN